ncbi:MAG TPA: hypothetical protein VN837_20460 [Chloroflexota bacterium]|nr:hypothetical protein [Chloroflexota bacterium]
MRGFTRRVECVHCANSRSFIQHGETSQRLIGQDEAGTLSHTAVLSCGRCGSFSLLSWWGTAAHSVSSASMKRLGAPTAEPIEQ